MKKIILELLHKYYKAILANWIAKLELNFNDRLSKTEIKEFVESSLQNFVEVIRTSEYLVLDQYLIDSYNPNLKALEKPITKNLSILLNPLDNYIKLRFQINF